jgi:hypothetical protein
MDNTTDDSFFIYAVALEHEYMLLHASLKTDIKDVKNECENIYYISKLNKPLAIFDMICHTKDLSLLDYYVKKYMIQYGIFYVRGGSYIEPILPDYLSKTLENVIGATKNQTAAVEDYITKQSLSLGVSDDKLRPAYARLIRSTKDTTETQKALNLAMDISSATGKDLDSVASALGKAYDGNSAALGKLGLGIDSTILKSGDMDKITKELGETFKGFAEQEANTVEGQFRRIGLAVNEAKESLGAALLPILEKIAGFVNAEVVPAIQGLVDGLTGQKSIRQATIDAGGNINLLRNDLSDANESGRSLGEALRTLAGTIGLIGTSSGTANPEFSKFVDNITKLVQGVNDLFAALQRLASITGGVIDLIGLQGLLARVESAGERFRGAPTSGGQYPTVVNQTNNFGALNSKSTANTVLKSLNDAAKTGTANKFAKPLIPGR